MMCSGCGRPLTKDEIGATRKLLSPQGEEYLCLKCLAEEIGTTEERLAGRIAYFKKMGCSYFD